jgi:hypothetical protein
MGHSLRPVVPRTYKQGSQLLRERGRLAEATACAPTLGEGAEGIYGGGWIPCA